MAGEIAEKIEEGFSLPSRGFVISIVAPAYNEADGLQEFCQRVASAMDASNFKYQLLIVDDGSTDNTLEIAKRLANENKRISVLALSRNFGKEIALTAGLDYANGDAVIPIDADLQDPPELIPKLVEVWKQGFDVVYATRTSRKGETWLKKTTAGLFYGLINRIGEGKFVPSNTGDFRLMSRRAVDAVIKMRERHRFMKGLFAIIGFRQTQIMYERDARYAGGTKWNYLSLLALSIEGITSFTTAPLKIATYVGILVGLGSLCYGAFIIYKTLVWGDPVAGYPSLMVAVLFLGSIQLISTGIIGEYLGRIFNETKNRPLYFVDEYISEK